MRILLILLLFCGCDAPLEKYSVSTTDMDGYHVTYYTDSVSVKDGCATFIDKSRGSYPMTVCGSFFVNRLR